MSLSTSASRGLIFDVQRFSLQDGPGIRILIFLKGCPLECAWCSNPESQISRKEIRYEKERCRACGQCVASCENGALVRDSTGAIRHDARKCRLRGMCVEACPHRARTWVGSSVTVEELMREVERELPFFRRSGGGVTLGGGEPLAQAEFAETLLKACKGLNIHTSMESCGHAPWKNLQRVAPFTDQFFFDLKHIDPVAHRKWTGVSNKLILNNLRKLSSIHSQIVIRYPLIPGVNASDAEVLAFVRFIKGVEGVRKVEISPYHRYGELKYASLDRRYPLQGVQALSESRVGEVVALIRSHGLDCETLH